MKHVSGLAALVWIAAGAIIFSDPGHAQPSAARRPPVSAVVIGAGYAAPGSVDVAPGQIITIFVRAPGKAPADPVSASPPLPYSLAGFSVLLRQTFPADPQPIPILSVADSQSCSIVAPLVCDTVSMITVQIPFELTPNARNSVPTTTVPQNFARLEISYNGNQTNSLFLNPMLDRIHVLNACDRAANLGAAKACFAVVERPDGSLVSPDNPAHPGEALTVSLAGLGATLIQVPTGAATPQPPPAVDGVLISLDTRVNAAPGMLVPGSSSPARSAQLEAGTVGIYQVTLIVPSLPAGTPACGNSVQSNLTVNIGRAASFDGVGICVSPAQ